MKNDDGTGIAPPRRETTLADELRRSQERYRALVETAFAGIGICDGEENFTFVNRTLEEMLGFAPGQLVGTNLSRLVDAAELGRLKEFTRQRREGLRNHYEVTVRRPDGTTVIVLVSCSPLAGADGSFEGTVAVVIDITELRRTEEKLEEDKRAHTESLEQTVRERTRRLEETQAQLVQSEKLAAVGRLAAGVAHEVNNPAGVLLMKLEFLLSITELEGLSERAVSTLETAVEQTRRIHQIVDHLLSFSRPSRGVLSSVQVNEVVRAALALSGRVLSSEGIEFHERLADDLPEVRADANELQQVVINLINNSVDAMPEGGRLTVVTGKGVPPPSGNGGASGGERRDVLIRVEDTGLGIAAAHRDSIFDPFFTTKQVGEGTGLGLSVSYGIVEKLGGRIEVESSLGQGTRMTVRLPSEAEEP